jgi:small nuclear ribonucleoprotein
MSSDQTLKELENYIGKSILIRVKGGWSIRGVLLGYDAHMNLVLSDAEEIFKNEVKKMSGMSVIRGDNIILVSPSG